MREIKNLDTANERSVYSLISHSESLENAFDNLNVSGSMESQIRTVSSTTAIESQRLWSPNNPVTMAHLEAMKAGMERAGLVDIPSISSALRDAHYHAEREEVGGMRRGERWRFNSTLASQRLKGTFAAEKKKIDARVEYVRTLSTRMEEVKNKESREYRVLKNRRDAEIRSINDRLQQNMRSGLNIGGFKRLAFAESMRQTQFGQIAYLQKAGFRFVRWKLSPFHSNGDICDLCAGWEWLSDDEKDEYSLLVAYSMEQRLKRSIDPEWVKGSTDFSGMIKLRNRWRFDLIIPELREWSDGDIRAGIEMFTTADDPRRKRAGHFPPHPLCKCYLSPMLDARS